jgi:sulfatase maturation enzyme AslB (radical SAM superfamily)
VCGIETQFLLDDPAIVRESLLCNYCHSSNRIRQLARGLLKFMQRKGFRVSTIDELSRELDQQEVSIYDTDSTSSISRYLESKKQYITSDYVPGVPSGTQLADRHYCQDLSNLSFADCSFHVVLSSDVMEHVRLYKNALREVFRVLKPGGTFIFNVPFISRMDDHETYVDIVDPEDPDKDSPIRPSVYHGDTLSETGSLLYRIYGKKLFRDLEDVGFLVNYERNTLPQLGIYDCELFVCIKPEQKELNVSSVQCIDLDRREPINSESNPPHECKWFNIELSSICNLRCRWCALDHNKPPQYLSLDRFEYLLKQIAACELPHLERIDLHNGGESLLHPRIDEVLQRLAEYRPKLKQPIHIAVLSNGTVLKESTLNLLVSGKTVDEIRLSIDGGTPKDFEDIRRGAKWPVVSKNVMRILDGIAQAQSKTTLGIICMVPLGKKAEVSWMDPEFRSVIERAHHLEIRHPHTWDGSMPDLNGLTPDPTLKNKSRTCKFLKHNLVVLANGDVTVCCADLNGRGVIGKTDEQNLMDIYRGKRHREMIDLWTFGRFAEIPLCSTCEGYYDFDSAPNPDREHATVSTAFQAEHRAQDRKASLTTRYHQAHGLIKSGDDDEAMEMYRSIYRRFADKSVRASLAAALEQLLARYPGFSAAHNDLGVIDFNKGDVAGAKYHYERAVNQDPANVTALKNLADFYFAAEKQPEQAQILYHRIRAEHPDDIETLLAMGHLSNSLGNVADSADFFRRALDISPEYEIAREIIHALSVPESQESA